MTEIIEAHDLMLQPPTNFFLQVHFEILTFFQVSHNGNQFITDVFQGAVMELIVFCSSLNVHDILLNQFTRRCTPGEEMHAENISPAYKTTDCLHGLANRHTIT